MFSSERPLVSGRKTAGQLIMLQFRHDRAELFASPIRLGKDRIDGLTEHPEAGQDTDRRKDESDLGAESGVGLVQKVWDREGNEEAWC